MTLYRKQGCDNESIYPQFVCNICTRLIKMATATPWKLNPINIAVPIPMALNVIRAPGIPSHIKTPIKLGP